MREADQGTKACLISRKAQQVPDKSRVSHEVLASLLTNYPHGQLINTLLTREKMSRLLSIELPFFLIVTPPCILW